MGLRNLGRAGDNFRWPTCDVDNFRCPIVAVPQRLEVGEDSFRYLGHMISCGGWVESTVRDRISCAWSKWRDLASLLVNHSIPP